MSNSIFEIQYILLLKIHFESIRLANKKALAHHYDSEGDVRVGFGAAVVEEHVPLYGDRVHRPLRVLDVRGYVSCTIDVRFQILYCGTVTIRLQHAYKRNIF